MLNICGSEDNLAAEDAFGFDENIKQVRAESALHSSLFTTQPVIGEAYP